MVPLTFSGSHVSMENLKYVVYNLRKITERYQINIMQHKVLIVGGSGFIGHNLAVFLKKKKFKVTVFR